MPTSWLLLACSITAPLSDLQPGMQVTYRGNFVAEKGDPAQTEKSFRLTVLVANSNARTVTVYWTVEERGRGGWSWLDQFGRFTVGGFPSREASQPALLYERPEGTHVIPLRLPIFEFEHPLSASQKWTRGRMEFNVAESLRIKDYEAWRVNVGNAYGRKRSLWVDQEEPLILAVEERVFIGQGEEHQLRYALESRKQLSGPETEKTVAGFDRMLQLRQTLGLQPRNKQVNWTPERLARLNTDLPKVREEIPDGPLARVAREATASTQRQETQSGAIAVLEKRLAGKPAPKPDLWTLAGDKFDWTKAEDQVVVLHFWDYKDAPLEEPYGQVAYIDFLYRQQREAGLKVFGVAVNERLQAAETRGKAVQSAKKLVDFMNLSYPLLLDREEGAIRAFGDPRPSGAKLPLVVLIDRAGKVKHFKVGFYEVDRQRGLVALENAVKQALETGE